MAELTLEALAKRVEELERKVASLTNVVPPTKDWRSVVGMSEDSEFTRQWLAEMEAIREADRKAARDEYGDGQA